MKNCFVAFSLAVLLTWPSVVLGQTYAGWTESGVQTTTSDKVGIGTTGPLSVLHVAKDVGLVNGGDAQGIFSGTGTLPRTTLIGYDTTLDYGFLQAAQYGVTWDKTIALQPKGGRVIVGGTNAVGPFQVARNLSFVGGGDAQGIFSGTGATPQTTLIGYDTTNDYGFVQAAQFGVTWSKKLVLQPKGGNVGIGTSTPSAQYALDVVGNANFSGTVTGTNIRAQFQDVAEWVPSAVDMEPGTVVILNPDATNEVMPSERAYDTSVAGVVSAQPGLILGEGAANKEQIATTGRVKVKVDATQAPIRIGDLLVTSRKPGYAMKSIPVAIGDIQMHRPGTIVGKALEPLDQGQGEILVLLSLQ